MKKTVLYLALAALTATACKKDKTSSENSSAPATNPNPVNATTVSDVDGNTYSTVKIGTQTWMVGNLRVTKYNDGTAIPNVTDANTWAGLTSGAYCWYEHDQNNKAKYGALYNWHAVNSGKLAPKGWHVPSDEEWTTLETYLANNGYNYDGTSNNTDVRAKIAKALADKNGWKAGNNIGSVGTSDFDAFRNKSGFTAVPGGFCTDLGAFVFVTEYAVFWSHSEENPNCAWYRDLTCNAPMVDKAYGFKKNGFSVRCVKD